MRTSFKLLLATVAIAFTAPAMAEPFQFTRDGLHFEGEKIVDGKGYTLRGRSIEEGKAFELRVSGNRVSGVMGESPVSFNLSEVNRFSLASAK